jgi:probable HAF family extracellular repeat protein
MRSRLMLLSAIALFAALATPLPLAAQDQQSKKLRHYTVTVLGTLGGGFSSGNGINYEGSVAGGSWLPGDTTIRAFIWHRGVLTDLGTLGGPNSDASEGPMINNRGEVVGFSDTLTLDPNAENFCSNFNDLPNPYTCVPFVWRNGVMSALPLLGGNNGSAGGINNRGQAAGVAENATRDPNCPYLHFEPVIWEKGQISEQLPTVSGDPDGAAGAINDKGQAVGFTGTCGPVHAVLWENGKATDLGSLGGATFNLAFDINNRGQVVGSSDLAGDTTHHAYLWTKDDGMQDLGTLYGLPVSVAQAINNKGQVVGFSQDFSNNTVASLWQDGVLTDLNTLIPPNSRLFLVEALGINDRGQIAGYAFDTSTGQAPAFLATPCDAKRGDDEGCEEGGGENAVPRTNPAALTPASRMPVGMLNRFRSRWGQRNSDSLTAPTPEQKQGPQTVTDDPRVGDVLDPLWVWHHHYSGYCEINDYTGGKLLTDGSCVSHRYNFCYIQPSANCPTGKQAVNPSGDSCGGLATARIDLARKCSF